MLMHIERKKKIILKIALLKVSFVDMKRWTPFLSLLLLSDELFDIYYVWSNKTNLQQNGLFTISVILILLNFLGVFIVTLQFGFQKKGKDIHSCWNVISLILTVFLTSFFMWMKLFQCLSSFNQKLKKNNLTQPLVLKTFLIELFLENIPQLVVQIINNNKSQTWEFLDTLGILITTAIIIYTLLTEVPRHLEQLCCKECATDNFKQNDGPIDESAKNRYELNDESINESAKNRSDSNDEDFKQ